MVLHAISAAINRLKKSPTKNRESESNVVYLQHRLEFLESIINIHSDKLQNITKELERLSRS